MSLQDKLSRGREALRLGVQAVAAPDLFPTPVDVAERVIDYLELFPRCRVLEPSAGTGRLVDAIREAEPSSILTLVEQDERLAIRLRAWFLMVDDFLDIRQEDCSPGLFDRIAMNPPFSNGADIRHVKHARRFLGTGGVLVAIVADGPRQESAFADWEDLERLPSGTFQGTRVRARIIRMRNES